MTPQELANQLELLADEVPTGAALALDEQMNQLIQTMQQQIGSSSPGAQEIGGAANTVKEQVANTIAALEQLRNTFRDVASRARAV